MKLYSTERNLLALTCALALLSACGGVMQPEESSQSTSVNIGLPDRGALKAQVPDIETRMDAYHIVVTPVDPACASATKVDQIDAYALNPVVTASLQQGCDYNVSLELGGRTAVTPPATTGATPPAPTAVTYEGKVKALLTTACVGCHVTGKQAPDLSTYAAAKAASDRIIARAVTAGNMPANDPVAKTAPLAQADKDTLKAWADGGFLEKDAAPATSTATTATTATTTPATPATTTPATTATTTPATAGAATTPATAGAATTATADKTKLAVIFYKNETPLRIAKEDIAGKPTLKASLKLQLQAAGREIGLGK